MRSLRFYARSHFGSLLGVTLAGTVLVGALAVGDCVGQSLRQMGLERLGKIDFALPGKDRLFREALAEDLWPDRALPNPPPPAASWGVPVLQLPGTAANQDGSRRANHAQILGVDARFWALAQSPSNFAANMGTNGVVLNEPLARQLAVKTGDTVLLRVQKPSLLSLEEPISPQDDVASGFRLTVVGIWRETDVSRRWTTPASRSGRALGGSASAATLRTTRRHFTASASARWTVFATDATVRSESGPPLCQPRRLPSRSRSPYNLFRCAGSRSRSRRYPTRGMTWSRSIAAWLANIDGRIVDSTAGSHRSMRYPSTVRSLGETYSPRCLATPRTRLASSAPPGAA